MTGPQDSQRWYIARGSEQHGPITDREIQQLIVQGSLRYDDQVWRPGFEEWRPAGEVPGLLAPPPLRSSEPRQASVAHLRPATPEFVAHSPSTPTDGGTETITRVEPPLVGVRGWLLFLCISLTILAPLFTPVQIGKTLDEARPNFKTVPGFESYITTLLVLTVLIVGAGIYAGIALWRRWPGANITAQNYLLMSMASACLAPFLIYLFVDVQPGSIGSILELSLPDMLRGAISAGVWYAYLRYSKRVRATFGPQS